MTSISREIERDR